MAPTAPSSGRSTRATARSTAPSSADPSGSGTSRTSSLWGSPDTQQNSLDIDLAMEGDDEDDDFDGDGDVALGAASEQASTTTGPAKKRKARSGPIDSVETLDAALAEAQKKKKKNATAQANFRTRRKGYMKRLEGTIAIQEEGMKELQVIGKDLQDEVKALRTRVSVLEKTNADLTTRLTKMSATNARLKAAQHCQGCSRGKRQMTEERNDGEEASQTEEGRNEVAEEMTDDDSQGGGEPSDEAMTPVEEHSQSQSPSQPQPQQPQPQPQSPQPHPQIKETEKDREASLFLQYLKENDVNLESLLHSKDLGSWGLNRMAPNQDPPPPSYASSFSYNPPPAHQPQPAGYGASYTFNPAVVDPISAYNFANSSTFGTRPTYNFASPSTGTSGIPPGSSPSGIGHSFGGRQALFPSLDSILAGKPPPKPFRFSDGSAFHQPDRGPQQDPPPLHPHDRSQIATLLGLGGAEKIDSRHEGYNPSAPSLANQSPPPIDPQLLGLDLSHLEMWSFPSSGAPDPTIPAHHSGTTHSGRSSSDLGFASHRPSPFGGQHSSNQAQGPRRSNTPRPNGAAGASNKERNSQRQPSEDHPDAGEKDRKRCSSPTEPIFDAEAINNATIPEKQKRCDEVEKKVEIMLREFRGGKGGKQAPRRGTN